MMTVSATKENATNHIRDVKNDVKDEMQDMAHRTGRKVRHLFNTASDEVSHASEVVTTEIRTNPVRSSMVALGVGVLIGALLRR
jgi:ElaB/YqjD/DUF883 family membrane-anchored ribosome-binding protein